MHYFSLFSNAFSSMCKNHTILLMSSIVPNRYLYRHSCMRYKVSTLVLIDPLWMKSLESLTLISWYYLKFYNYQRLLTYFRKYLSIRAYLPRPLIIILTWDIMKVPTNLVHIYIPTFWSYQLWYLPGLPVIDIHFKGFSPLFSPWKLPNYTPSYPTSLNLSNFWTNEPIEPKALRSHGSWAI